MDPSGQKASHSWLFFFLNFVGMLIFEGQSGGPPQQSAMYRPEERTEASELWLRYQSQCVQMSDRPSYLWQTSSCWEKVCIRCPEVPYQSLTGWSPRSQTALPEWRGSRGRLKAQTWPSASRPLATNTDLKVKFRTSCSYFLTTTTTTTKRQLAFIFRLFWDVA